MTSNLPEHVHLERQALTSPLGIRFVDDATRQPIGGLKVEAYPPAAPWQRVTAVPTRSDVYGFHGLPGLRDFENQTDDDLRWVLESPLSPRPFVVEVVDPAGRFLPARFVAEAPARVDALQDSASPPFLATLRTEVLYSSPSRLPPGGCAVLRAQLCELGGRDNREHPAAWVVAEVSTTVLDRKVAAQGAADDQGRLTIIFPYPEPVNVNIGSPPSGAPQLLSEQTWTLVFHAWHTFAEDTPDMLDLDTVRELMHQSPAGVFDGDSPPESFTGADLIFGRELVVPVRLPGDSRPRQLFLSKAASPP
jgi:hypothetical protein